VCAKGQIPLSYPAR